MTASTGFLQIYDLRLTTLAPLFIGDGRTILKKSYLYHGRTNEVSLFDEQKFFDLIYRKNLVDQYEAFMLGRMDNLFTFLTKDCHLTEADWKFAVRATFDAGAALDSRHTLTDLHCFIRNGAGRLYVPGSSVKGALRTVLLQQMMSGEGPHNRLDPPARGEKFGTIPEKRYLHTLKLNRRRPEDMINSVMRGLLVSDSGPLPDEAVVLADKWDCQVDGTLKKVPVCRESIRPGTEIHFTLTLDQSILQGSITGESLMQAIDGFDEYYWDTYLRRFAEPAEEAKVFYENCLFLGGGAGFFSKSLVYPYLGEERGLRQATEIMQNKFRGHHHEQDEAMGISPHTLKYTRYAGKFYPMGMCGVAIR